MDRGTRLGSAGLLDVMTAEAKTRDGRRPGVIFDRDGVLLVDHGYVGDLERMEWMPGAVAAVARLTRAGYGLAVATNQSGVARGYFDLAAVDRIHAAMRDDLAAAGGRIETFQICPYLPDAPVAAFSHPDHPDRKPNPGMLRTAIAELGLDPARTVMIGDKGSDLEAARAAGVAGVKFSGGDLDQFILGLGLAGVA